MSKVENGSHLVFLRVESQTTHLFGGSRERSCTCVWCSFLSYPPPTIWRRRVGPKMMMRSRRDASFSVVVFRCSRVAHKIFRIPHEDEDEEELARPPPKTKSWLGARGLPCCV